MRQERTVSNRPAKIFRIVLKTIAFLLLFVLLIFVLLLTPPVQRFLTARVQHYLENKLHTKVIIGRISFGLSGKIGLNNVFIGDKSNDTLVSGGSIKAHLDYLKLFSNEVRIKDLELDNVTAKIKRVLPDTVYNFQFVVNAFTSEGSKSPDTASSPPMKLDIATVSLKNINLTYTDAVTGSDMFAHIGDFAAKIDTLDPYTQHFVIPSFILRNSVARVKQVKPLVEPKPLEQHINEATAPSSMNLQLGSIVLEKVNIDYGNDVSALYAAADIGLLNTTQRSLDMPNNKVDLDKFTLNDSKLFVRLGKTEQAKIVTQEAKKEVVAQKQAGWGFLVSNLNLDNNTIQFDDDNKPALKHGIDYSHLSASDLSLEADNLVMTPDSIALNVKRGSVKEKSGLTLDQFTGDIVYASHQSYVRNLYIKTPGSEIKKAFVVNYPSIDALTKHPEQASFQVDLSQTKLQVKDILLFVPELKSNPALRNPGDVWSVNLVGSGTMDHFNFETLQFAGLSSTQINAHGSLMGLTNPKNAGGNFVIDRFHTNQNDIELLTGTRLSNEQMNLPHDFTIRGTINGNAGTINTKMRILTSDGNIAVNGKLSNFTNLTKAKYNGQITTSGLQVGKILRQESTIGPLSATIVATGQGLTPDAINTKFSAVITSASYEQYEYKNINLSGSLQKTNFDVHAVVKDQNADADITVSGDYSDHPAFTIHGMIDSIKTLPLHLTTEPLIVRGRIDGSASDLTAENVNADILITQALLVSGNDRLNLDTLQLQSGKNDTANYIRLNSSIVKANIAGHYRLADLGGIMQNSIQPYFTTRGAAKLAAVQPYHFAFSLDVIYDPVFAVFVPGFTDMQPLHASGNFSNNGGLNMQVTTSSVVYQGNTISDVKLTANTTSNGLEVNGGIAHLKSSAFDLYNSRVNAVILNNKIDFSFGTDDAKGKTKYFIAGLFSQPTAGVYTIQLKSDSLRLNYQSWSVSPNNLITIKPDDIIASNFVLQNADQRLSINSPDSRGKQLLLVELSNFRLATITGFANVDSLLADGLINGNMRLGNFMQQPNFTGDLTITDLSVQKDTVGNVKIHASSGEANRYNIESTITGHGNDVSLAGWFATEANDTKLNLDLNVKTLELHSIEPFTAGAIRNTSGNLHGSIAIRGSVTQPALNGDLNFNRSSFALSMLGSQFNVDDQKISFTNDGISFSKFTVKDSSGNALTLDGNIITNNFINYEYNLKLTARNFQLLNSTKKDNPIYYGRMTINTDLSISGTEVKPAVDGRIVVDNGTALTFVVPQGDESAESREGIVEFVDMSNPASDTLFRKYDSLNTSGILGMDIALNIEIKKEAVFNIIVDPANGDFLNAQGEAQLTAGIDPSGKITMTGNYTLEKGSYQISFNLLQRKFEISKGSTITWTGEPTTAQLDVTAIYVANVPPIDLVEDQIASSSAAIKNTYMQKLPFQVHLNLTGELMKPVVKFDIILPENKNYGVSNDVVSTVEYKLGQLRADEGETNKQVFSVLLLNRFVGENPFSPEGGSGYNVESYVRQSASKLLTQQLNQLAAGLINGVDINFDVVSTEDYTTGSMRNKTDLNVNVSKKLLNDRLKISVGSEFGLEGPQTTNQQGNNIAGNLSAEYQLSRDGRYLLRFFEKNDYEGELYGYVIETGLSFVITVDYNRFKEIFRKRKQKVESTDTQKVTTK